MANWLIRSGPSDRMFSPVRAKVECCRSLDHFGCRVTECFAARMPSCSIIGHHPQRTGGIVAGCLTLLRKYNFFFLFSSSWRGYIYIYIYIYEDVWQWVSNKYFKFHFSFVRRRDICWGQSSCRHFPKDINCKHFRMIHLPFSKVKVFVVRYYTINIFVARGVMVIVAGNGHGDTNSNPGRGQLHFT